MTWMRVWIGLIGLLLALPAAAHSHARATYLGNEGVLVTRGEVKVVFDAFYADGLGTYLVPSRQVVEGLLEGRAPYDGVDAVFVSHVHADHFAPASMLKFLRTKPEVSLYAPAQVVDALREHAGDAEVPGNLHPLDLKPGEERRFQQGGLEILAVPVPHAGGKRMEHIQNVLFRVTLDDQTTVMHLGDAGADEKVFKPLYETFDDRPTDAAFVPYWFFGQKAGRAIVQRIGAGQTVGIHVPREAVGQGEAWRERYEADLFVDPGEGRDLGPRSGPAEGSEARREASSGGE
ncbi:hypothetical protein ABI59_23440 [Acidobacteria bacterium Mor1]|nr:hypothetical protein ABI59_23440 [Acidobacteria bacterium Mor1]